MSGEYSDKKARVIFQINNYDLMLSVLGDTDVTTIMNEKNYLQRQLDERTAAFVEMDLKPYFGNLIAFMNQMETEKEPTKVAASK